MNTDQTRKQKTSNKEDIAGALFSLMDIHLDGECFYSKLGIVKDVNLEDATCKVEIPNTQSEGEGEILPDVRLQQITESGLLIEPAKDFPVLISFTDKTTAFVALYSKIEKIVFQNGENGGLIKIIEQTEKLNELVNTTNEINQNIKDLKSIFNTWIPVPNDGGAALKTALTSWITNIVPDAKAINKDDFENLNITH